MATELDRELRAIAAVAAALDGLEYEECYRVLWWARERYVRQPMTDALAAGGAPRLDIRPRKSVEPGPAGGNEGSA